MDKIIPTNFHNAFICKEYIMILKIATTNSIFSLSSGTLFV
jgi:hypothetical protein